MTQSSKTSRASYIRAGVLAMLVIMVGGKWYSYVAHAETPFDDFGAGINSLMPGPIKRFGCDMLKKRFGDIPIPPRGCDVEGRWA